MITVIKMSYRQEAKCMSINCPNVGFSFFPLDVPVRDIRPSPSMDENLIGIHFLDNKTFYDNPRIPELWLFHSSSSRTAHIHKRLSDM